MMRHKRSRESLEDACGDRKVCTSSVAAGDLLGQVIQNVALIPLVSW